MMQRSTTVLVEGLRFPEGPRWHDGRLFCSDQHDRRVLAITPDGSVETIVEVEGCPSGLGWLPDGRLLVVSMHDRRLLRLDPDGLTEVADLSELATWHCNDMVVDASGRAYIGNFGFDLDGGADARTAVIVRVDPDGAMHVAAEELRFPNGTVITPDGATLIVGESAGGCLTAFDVDADGSLSNRRLWAQLVGAVPDGICLDAQGAIWSACPLTGRVLRVREGGEVTDEVEVSRKGAYACMLGGADRRTLFVCAADASDPTKTDNHRGAIATCTVDIPGAGLP
ncbi:MAG: SMP-30/gluconolactonase/LRE family protein [Acidimicrobiia bacterium]